MSPYAQSLQQKIKKMQDRETINLTPPATTNTPRRNPSLATSTNKVPAPSAAGDDEGMKDSGSGKDKKHKKKHRKVKLTSETMVLQESGRMTSTTAAKTTAEATDLTKTQGLPFDMLMHVHKNKLMTVEQFLEDSTKERPPNYTLELSAPMFDQTAVLRRSKSSEQLTLSSKVRKEDKEKYKQRWQAWARDQEDGDCRTKRRRKRVVTKTDGAVTLKTVMQQLFGGSKKEEVSAREFMDIIVLTHHRITDSETLVRELLDVYHNPLKMCSPEELRGEDKARWERENREWALRCLLLWSKCVCEFDTDTRALPMFASFLCEEAYTQHVTFSTECCRCLLPLLIPMFSKNTKKSATLSCTKTFHDINAFLSPLSAPLEWTLASDTIMRPFREKHPPLKLRENHVSFARDLNQTVLSAISAPPTAAVCSSTGSPTTSVPQPLRAGSPVISQRSLISSGLGQRSKTFQQLSPIKPPSSQQLLPASQSSSPTSEVAPTTPRKVSQIDYQFLSTSQLTNPTRFSRPRGDHCRTISNVNTSNGTASTKDRYILIRSTLKNLDEKESQVTESHLAIFWRSCVFARTTTHGKQQCFHEFVAHEGVAAAAVAFAISSHNVVVLARNLVECGELCPVTPGATFDNNSERFFFVDEVPKVQLIFPAHDYHSGFFQPFCVEDTLPENIPLLSVPPLELARQLTLLEHDMFRSWRLAELESGKWDQDGVRMEVAPNISALMDHTIRLAQWVTSEVILSRTNLKQRVKAFTYFVELADACRALHNFNGMYAIFVGLRNPGLKRLTATHNALSRLTQERYQALTELCNESNNYKVYRHVLATSTPPLLPIIELLLCVVSTSKEAVTLEGAPRMDHLRTIATVYRTVLDARRMPYALKPSPQLQTLLKNGLVTTETSAAHVIKLAKIIEPPPLVSASSVVSGATELTTTTTTTSSTTSHDDEDEDEDEDDIVVCSTYETDE